MLADNKLDRGLSAENSLQRQQGVLLSPIPRLYDIYLILFFATLHKHRLPTYVLPSHYTVSHA